MEMLIRFVLITELMSFTPNSETNKILKDDNMDEFINQYIIELGPDTWMEGDISIKKEDLTDITYYDKNNYYEFKIVGNKSIDAKNIALYLICS